MVFGRSKPSSRQPWTPGSFPGGNPSSPSMLFSNMPVFPIAGPPFVGAPAPAMAFSTYTPMFIPTQMPTPVQTVIPMQVSTPVQTVQTIPITVQPPSPVFVQVTPSHSHAVLQALPPPPPPQPRHVPSPVVPSPPQVFQLIGDDHHTTPGPRSPGNITLNLYVNSPGRQSRQLRDTPSPQPQQQQLDWHLLQQQLQPQQQQQSHPARPQSVTFAVPLTPLQVPLHHPIPCHPTS